jgi:hypothetical protein
MHRVRRDLEHDVWAANPIHAQQSVPAEHVVSLCPPPAKFPDRCVERDVPGAAEAERSLTDRQDGASQTVASRGPNERGSESSCNASSSCPLVGVQIRHLQAPAKREVQAPVEVAMISS